MVEAGNAFPLFTLGFTNDAGEVVRDPAQPDLPHFLEVYEELHGKPLEGLPRKAWDSIYNLNVMATRAILLPAGTPQEIVDVYEQAMRDALAEIDAPPALKEYRKSVVQGKSMAVSGK